MAQVVARWKPFRGNYPKSLLKSDLAFRTGSQTLAPIRLFTGRLHRDCVSSFHIGSAGVLVNVTFVALTMIARRLKDPSSGVQCRSPG